jgi:hypothetical protein
MARVIQIGARQYPVSDAKQSATISIGGRIIVRVG